MGTLADPKREKFAQLIVRGLPIIEAHERAGYKRNNGNASTLKNRPDIKARIEELRMGSAAMNASALMDHLRETGIDQSFIIKSMVELIEKAAKKGDHKVALDGYKEIGKELFGMFTGPSQQKKKEEDEPLRHKSTDALQAFTESMASLPPPPFKATEGTPNP